MMSSKASARLRPPVIALALVAALSPIWREGVWATTGVSSDTSSSRGRSGGTSAAAAAASMGEDEDARVARAVMALGGDVGVELVSDVGSERLTCDVGTAGLFLGQGWHSSPITSVCSQSTFR
jgi:hypothetical protein